jgi:hypothetical protein
MVLMGFVTIGSFDRGAESVRLRAWKLELVARKRATIASRSRQVVITAFVPELVNVPVLPVAAVVERESPRPLPAAERRTRIRRDHGEVLTHISV